MKENGMEGFRKFLEEQLTKLAEHVPKAKQALLDKDRIRLRNEIAILLELADNLFPKRRRLEKTRLHQANIIAKFALDDEPEKKTSPSPAKSR
jgi:hypothetical protein